MAQTTTLGTRELGEGISIMMAGPFSVQYLKIEFLQPFQPPCELTLRIAKILDPGERFVASSEDESPSQEVMTEVMCELNHSQQFSAGDAVLAFRFRKEMTCIRNGLLFSIWPNL